MTPRYTDANLWRAGLATKEMGEAMAPASESPPSGGNSSGAGAAPIGSAASGALAIALLLVACACACACGDDARPQARPAEIAARDRAAADPARGLTTELDGASPAFGAALLAELTGDVAAARAGYERDRKSVV